MKVHLHDLNIHFYVNGSTSRKQQVFLLNILDVELNSSQ